MKAFASSVLYAFSIVLAVGIGMFQVGGKEILVDSRGSSELPDCEVALVNPPCGGAIGCESYSYVAVDENRPAAKTLRAPTITYGAPSSQQCYQTDKICSIQGVLTLDWSPCNYKGGYE